MKVEELVVKEEVLREEGEVVEVILGTGILVVGTVVTDFDDEVEV